MEILDLPESLLEQGLGEDHVLELLSRQAEERAAKLGDPRAVAHMDPPTPSIASELVGLNARLNQNLLHPDLSPFATVAERRVIDWLSPFFGMAVGHMCAGSTIANLTALWCAREYGARRVIASVDAHLSVAKSAHILGMPFEPVPVDSSGQLNRSCLDATEEAVVVLTAGTTGRGAIDELGALDALWVHVDAAWAGPLRFTRFAKRLAGIEHANSVAISAHKWMFQPKESAIIFLADSQAQEKISFGGSYLVAPNIGVQGSRGAAGVALLGTLLAWGREGLSARIERCVDLSEDLAAHLEAEPRIELNQHPASAVVNWRPRGIDTEEILATLGSTASRTSIDGELWVRHVVANPQADLALVRERIETALRLLG